jgi:hypothetical protein
MLEYALVLNELTDDPNDFRAQVVNVRSFTQNDVIDRIMKIGAGLTRSDIVSVLEAEKQVVTDIVADGGAVNTDLFYASPSIQGVFTATAEPDAHTVRINLHPGQVLQKAIADMKTKKVPGGATSSHAINAVIDAITGEVNIGLTVGGIVTIQGHKIKISGSDADVGLYFRDAAGGAEEKYHGVFGENLPSRLTFIMPALTPGVYRLSIKTKFGGNRDLKDLRTIDFPTDLTVRAATP